MINSHALFFQFKYHIKANRINFYSGNGHKQKTFSGACENELS